MTKSDFITKWRYFQPAVMEDTQKRSIPMLCSSCFHRFSVSMENVYVPWSLIVERIRRTQAKGTKWHKPPWTGVQRGMTSFSVQPIGRGSIHKLNFLSHYYVILSRMLWLSSDNIFETHNAHISSMNLPTSAKEVYYRSLCLRNISFEEFMKIFKGNYENLKNRMSIKAV